MGLTTGMMVSTWLFGISCDPLMPPGPGRRTARSARRIAIAPGHTRPESGLFRQCRPARSPP